MSPMTVLFVTLYPIENNTSVTKSNYGIIKGLADLGMKVTIMMPSMSAQNGSYDDAYDLSMCKVLRIGGKPFGELLPTEDIHTLRYKIKHKIQKEFSILDITKAYLKEARNMTIPQEKFDIVISTSDPKTSHLFVMKLIDRGLKFDRWIQHWGDPLNGDITRRNCYPDQIIQCYEKQILKHADKVVYVSPFTADVQKKVHPNLSNKIIFVPLPCEDHPIITNSASRRKSDPLRLSYLGDYSPHIRDIKPLYNVCKSLEDVELTIAGHSSLRLSDAKNIKILPRIPLSKVHEIENISDVIVSVGNLRGTQIPGKIYYSAATQKHILVIVDGDNPEQMKQYLNQYNRYIICDNNEDSIRLAIEKISLLKDCVYKTPSILWPTNNVKAIIF